jgi:hypothetical protein
MGGATKLIEPTAIHFRLHQVDYAGRVLREFPTATAAGEANQIDNSRIGLLCNEAHRDAHIHGMIQRQRCQ